MVAASTLSKRKPAPPITTVPSERQKGFSTTAVGTATTAVQPAVPMRALAKYTARPCASAP